MGLLWWLPFPLCNSCLSPHDMLSTSPAIHLSRDWSWRRCRFGEHSLPILQPAKPKVALLDPSSRSGHGLQSAAPNRLELAGPLVFRRLWTPAGRVSAASDVDLSPPPLPFKRRRESGRGSQRKVRR
ncbi:hypothetical protein ACFX2K_019820 [Malus domestica]